jgi:hypothetical protein
LSSSRPRGLIRLGALLRPIRPIQPPACRHPSTATSPPSRPIGEALGGGPPRTSDRDGLRGALTWASPRWATYHPVTGSSRVRHDPRRTAVAPIVRGLGGEVHASPLAPLARGESERTVRSCRNTKVRSCVVADRSSIRRRGAPWCACGLAAQSDGRPSLEEEAMTRGERARPRDEQDVWGTGKARQPPSSRRA